jgi:hypothetical protein
MRRSEGVDQRSLPLAKRRYPRPSVTVDAAIVSKPETAGEAPQLLLVQRKNPPCKVCWIRDVVLSSTAALLSPS